VLACATVSIATALVRLADATVTTEPALAAHRVVAAFRGAVVAALGAAADAVRKRFRIETFAFVAAFLARAAVATVDALRLRAGVVEPRRQGDSAGQTA
jgi:hypothetical protein